MSRHATAEAERRGIDPGLIDAVLQNPDQVVPAFGGKVAYQSRLAEQGRDYLLRVVVSESSTTPVVVTMYKTSRVAKYWRKS